MAVNAVGDAPLIAGASRRGLSLWAKKVQTGTTANGGGGQLTQATPFVNGIVSAVACIDAAAPLGDGASVVAVSTSGANVLIERYQNTGGTDPTLVDSTTDILVDLIVVGYQ